MDPRTHPGDAGAPVPPPSAPRRRRTLIAVIAIAALAGASAAVIALTGRSAPAETVERYLTALLERDAAAALDEVEPGSVPDDEDQSVFLDEAAMRTDWSFGSIDTAPIGNDAGRKREKATVELSGFGRTGEAVFAVVETDDGWRIANPFAWVSFASSSLTYLDVDGVRLADAEPETVDPRPEFPVFPGPHRFFESLPAGVALTSPDDYDLLLLPPSLHGPREAAAPVPEMTLGGEPADLAQQQIREIVDVCAASPERRPLVHDGDDFTQYCPFEFAGEEELEDGTIAYAEEPVEWRVTEYPVFALVDPPKTADPNQALFGGFRAVVEKPGTISAAVAVQVYGEDLAVPEMFTAAVECEFAPDGFRSRLTEDDALAMYFLGVHGESAGATRVGLAADGCTHSMEAR